MKTYKQIKELNLEITIQLIVIPDRTDKILKTKLLKE